jgi:O-acetylhomoserine (thiol)-lyase
VDIEVVSSTKYISGGATSLGGLILDYNSFDWNNSPKLALMNLGNSAFTFKLRREILRNLGAYMTPQVAYMQSLGLETLSLRYSQSSTTAATLSLLLQELKDIKSVNYNGLPDNPYYNLSIKQFGKNPGAMLTFDLESKETCYRFLNRLKLIKRATNLFDNKSLAIHPYSTIFGPFSEEVRKQMHISDCTIRLSVGLEETEALYADIIQALN